MLKMSQLKELRIDGSVQSDFPIIQSIIASFPLLQRLCIDLDFDDLTILSDAPHEWQALNLTFNNKTKRELKLEGLNVFGDLEEDDVHDEEPDGGNDELSFDWSKLTDFVDTHGHTLRSLELTFPPSAKIPEGLIAQVYNSCSYLTTFQFKPENGSGISYSKRELSLEDYRSISIRPLLTLFSKLRSIDIRVTDNGSNANNWISELLEFGGNKRKFTWSEVRSHSVDTHEGSRSGKLSTTSISRSPETKPPNCMLLATLMLLSCNKFCDSDQIRTLHKRMLHMRNDLLSSFYSAQLLISGH